MKVEECLRAGRLTDARALLIEAVKAAPVDTGRRMRLMQVLALLGEWDKARHHLNMIVTQEPARAAVLNSYQDILTAEKERSRIWEAWQIPACLPAPPDYGELYQAYLHAVRDGAHALACELLHEINNERPEMCGTIGDNEFAWIAETDARLFGFMEAFVHGRYVWIPFESIEEITINPPQTFFDLIWAPATVATWEGMTLQCVLPVLYPDSFTQADELTRMGRITQWSPLGGGLTRAFGQHVYQTEQSDVSLLDIREIRFQQPGGN